MFQVHKFGSDARAAVIGSEDGCVVALQGGRNRVVLHLPPPVVETLRAELPAQATRDRAEKPAPPKAKDWPALLRRLEQGRPTANDAELLRTLFLHLGLTTI